MKHVFLVTSAVNSRFGVYPPHQRLQQTVATLTSIRERVADAKIIVVESSADPLTAEQEAQLEAACDILVDFTNDADVKEIAKSDNWDIVKNTTESLCFLKTLNMCLKDGDFDGYDRIHKVSGRYVLNDDFDLAVYEQYPENIITTKKFKSQFPLEVTGGIEAQYMSRLWSWPANITGLVAGMYNDGINYIAGRLAVGGYCDLEHVLYKFLPQALIKEVSPIGIHGGIAPNGQLVKE
jgi:hypothetical protein